MKIHYKKRLIIPVVVLPLPADSDPFQQKFDEPLLLGQELSPTFQIALSSDWQRNCGVLANLPGKYKSNPTK